ncbi:phosphoribosylformylglycinamidine synthase I [bacterium]|nr:phosphoribosylformylglycinamidine synthase I [bacterium]|tara:strand:- start:39807 stop:40469 length:663 start_codon:yes stop_codon:yes gene_type:complete
MKVGVVVFPGSNCDRDAYRFMSDLGFSTQWLWHGDTNLKNVDLVFLPGGFSYGDYLRSGAIAKFSPIMEEIKEHADKGGAVVGICNGFQILIESGLLPGAMRTNKTNSFICDWSKLVKIECVDGPWNGPKDGELLNIPIAHMEGNWYGDEKLLQQIKENKQIIYRYEENMNGSVDNIAGLLNKKGNVLGMMPHPERASSALLGSSDGIKVFENLTSNLRS